MKFGHRITGTVRAYDDKGRGTFEIENQDKTTSTVVIPFSAVGDELAATFIKRDSGVKVARIEEIKTPGPDRVAAPCPHAGVCGGCLWQHLGYDAQLKLKLGMINSAFEKAGHDEWIADVMPAEKQFHFRNRMDYAVGWNSEIGLKEYGSWNRYIDLTTCLLLDGDVGKILQEVRDWMKESDLQPWDAKFYTGDMRYVVVREGKHTDERLITLVVKDAARVSETQRKNIAERLSPFATSILLGEQSLQTDISLAQKFETLKGNPWLEEEVNGIRYRIHPNSFFQTNTDMAGKLQETVKQFIGTPKTILDLYCGLGFFGIYLAKQHSNLKVSGFEIDAEAIELAKHNAATNNVGDRCNFTSGPAEDLSWKDIEADTIILDPPRSGLHPKVLKTVLEKKPQTIVYVSCNYHRLVEELKQFKELYRIEELKALDLFPHTPHVEVVTKLVRKA
ncbi:MAG: 23S rRNA (uracil(1939)-C(5))-methyltransferase RlmD [Patescibacteria group bacterium]